MIFGVMCSTIYERSHLASLVFTSKPSGVKKEYSKMHRILSSLIPVDFFYRFYIPHHTVCARYLRPLQPGKSTILWHSQVPGFFLKKRPIKWWGAPISISLPPDVCFGNLIYFFCKTRQNWNIPQASNNSMHIISLFFFPEKLCFS